MCTNVFTLLVFVVSFSTLNCYEAPEDKEDIFASRACPAFLVFDNAVYLSDMTIELPCHCKPKEVHSVVWYYQKKLGSKDVRVLTDFRGTAIVDSTQIGRDTKLRNRFSIRLFSLLVFRAQLADSGHYLCGTTSGEFFYGYYVDIQQVRRVTFPHGPNPSEMIGARFQMFTSFWPWSVCDRCGVPGEQVRVGLCYVKSDYLLVRYQQSMEHRVASCGSPAVPAQFGLKKGGFGAELSVQRCHVPCPLKPVTSTKQQALFKFLSDRKKASPGAPVFYYNHQADSNLILTCPGAKPQHAVAWDFGSTPLYRTQNVEGLNQSSRMFIDSGHYLNFRPAKPEDKGSYYCWIQGKIVAEIRLGVHLGLVHQHRFSDPETLYALRLMLFSCL
uniref:Ig-like domain-containing protein n=2 Tax=Denticeps clupeoides TaxID=299321 RepID=A0AAY4C1T9_9TELE